MTRVHLLLVLTINLLLSLGIFAQAESISIPRKTVVKPASDLLDASGKNLDVGEASARAEKGEDLSLLNPMDSKLWQNKVYSASDADAQNYPSGTVGVKWMYFEAAYNQSYMADFMGRVQSQADPNQYYRMTLSRATHAALLRGALLRKLGYFLPAPKFYRDLTVQFKDEDEKKLFLKKAQSSEGMETDFESRKWVTKDDAEKHTLTFASAVLEPATAEYFDTRWGFAPPAKDPAQIPTIQRLSHYRAYRALILPYVLADIPESINRFSPRMGAIMAGKVVLTHPFAESFSAATWEDARWLLRRLASLSERDLREVVMAASLPSQLNELVYAKLLYRIENALELFELTDLQKMDPPSLQINSGDGVVVDGKVMNEFIPGYPQRFNHGDRESPFQDWDLARYISIEAITTAIGRGTDYINQQLNFWNQQSIATDRQKEIQDRILQHLQTNPFEPLYQQLEPWGGPIAGLTTKISRHIATGPYFGSSASVQLVDDFQFGGNIGYMATLDGVPTWTPLASANLVVLRDYTHVRPINSIKEGTKINWGEVMVPFSMLASAFILDGVEKVSGATPDAPKMDPVDKFMTDLREGEVFNITTSVALAGYAQVNAPIQGLLGVQSMNFLNSVAFGVDGSLVVLAQTTVMKTGQGLQIFVRKQPAAVLGAQFDTNFFVNLVRLRAETNKTKITTDAFVIDYTPGLIEDADPKGPQKTGLKDDELKKIRKTREDLGLALRAIMTNNNTEFLYSRFSDRRFRVDHDMFTTDFQARLLMGKMMGFNESHELSMTPPPNTDHPELDPKENKVTLFSYKKGELVGRDLFGFVFDTLNGFLSWFQTNVSIPSQNNPNPANMPYGRAYWKIIDSESELTSTKDKYPVSAWVKHIWGGWSISRDDFFDLVDEIEDGLKGTSLVSYHLIDKPAFQNVKSVDFYRITEQLSLMENGIWKIRDLLVQPNAGGGSGSTQPDFIQRIFRKLSLIGGYNVRQQDQDMFHEIVANMFGNGNYEKGLDSYVAACRDYYDPRDGSGPPRYTSGYYLGTFYECLLPWTEKLLKLAHEFPQGDRRAQTEWATQVLYVLDEYIPLPRLLKYLGDENYILFVRVNGFRSGDEDGDLEFFSNTIGVPSGNFDYANGLITYWAKRTGITPLELDHTNGGIQ